MWFMHAALLCVMVAVIFRSDLRRVFQDRRPPGPLTHRPQHVSRHSSHTLTRATTLSPTSGKVFCAEKARPPLQAPTFGFEKLSVTFSPSFPRMVTVLALSSACATFPVKSFGLALAINLFA